MIINQQLSNVIWKPFVVNVQAAKQYLLLTGGAGTGRPSDSKLDLKFHQNHEPYRELQSIEVAKNHFKCGLVVFDDLFGKEVVAEDFLVI